MNNNAENPKLAVFTEAECNELLGVYDSIECFENILDALHDYEIKGLSLHGVFMPIQEKFARLMNEFEERVQAATEGGAPSEERGDE